MANDKVTVINRGAAKTEAEYVYAHVACHREQMARVRNAGRPAIGISYARRSVREL